MVGYMLASLAGGRRAKANEWGGVTMDWQTPTPPNLYNFDEEPVMTGDLYDYTAGIPDWGKDAPVEKDETAGDKPSEGSN